MLKKFHDMAIRIKEYVYAVAEAALAKNMNVGCIAWPLKKK